MEESNNDKQAFKYIGKPRPLIDGLEKVTGRAKYTADIAIPGMLHLKLVLAQAANAALNEIDKEEAEQIPGVVAVLTAADLPTYNKLINSRNSAILAKDRTLWVGQPVAVIVAETAVAAADAAELLIVDYDPQPVVTSVLDAIKPEAPKVWPNGFPTAEEDMSTLHGNTELGEAASGQEALNNLQSKNNFERGDVTAGFAASDVFVEKQYRISSVHQGYLEPHAIVVDPDPLGRGMTIYTATQGMYGVRDEVARLLDLPPHAVVVKPMTFGGGFGAKYGIYEPLAAAVALKLKRPVQLRLTRSEDFLSSTPSPEIVIKLKTGAKKDGTVQALEAAVYTNNGPFSFNHGGIVAAIIGGTYKWQNLKIDTFEVNTFTNPVGAYRAPGAPQAVFAIEGNIDLMAHELGLDPLEFRYQNCIEEGDLTGTGSKWSSTVGLKRVLDQAREHPLWKNRQAGDGIGMAVGGWPNFMGNADVTCRVDSDGRVRLETGIVDISGTKSSLILVAAESLGVDPSVIEMAQGDTTGAYGPGSGGSQVTYTLAPAVAEAAADARRQLLEIAANEFEAAFEDLEIVNGEARVVGVPDKTMSIGKLAGKGRSVRGVMPIMGRGQSSPEKAGPGFVVHMLQVNIDQDTGEVNPLQYVAIQDIGLAINPLLVEGQMHGGAIQSLGIGLHEGMVFNGDGQLLTGTFVDYNMPRADNSPNVEALIVEHPNPLGLHGARGMAEPAITAGAAVLASAIRDLTGVSMTETPMRAEKIWQELRSKKAKR